ncbi:hypothetical protein [Sulfuritortus calidifontis]|uniref:hypothetical protein n=1 Tax=Sulfuritortus calidifontis TaxID=1914471 RepID=UPI000F8325D6|nr:hypothetical protein [Sulfuritortus calidifontis]
MDTDCGIDWATIADIATAVIALCAFGITWWQTSVARRHNRLSVTPHLTTWSHSDDNASRYQIDLINNGIGPALIKLFFVQVDGQTISGEAGEPLLKAIKILFPQYNYHSHVSYVANGYMMSEKENRPLVVLQFIGEHLPKPEEVEHATKRARLIIKYQSIYGDEYCLDTETSK